MLRFSVRATALLAIFLVSCGNKNTGDRIVSLASNNAGVKPSSSGDANSSSSASNGGSAKTPTGGTCKPAFSFAEAQQRCTNCHSAAGGNAEWSKADGSEADWKDFAAQIRASVETDYMPMGIKFEPADKEKFLAYMDGLTGNCTPATETDGGSLPPPDPNMMSLSEAKAQCAGCHVTNGPGAKWWDKADGSEEEWRAVAPALLAAVERGISSNSTMPPAGFTGNNKARFTNFINQLRQNSSNIPVTYSLQTARPLCVGCHNQSRAEEGINLELETTWRNEQKVAEEVSDGKMPESFRLNPREKEALMRFINSL